MTGEGDCLHLPHWLNKGVGLPMVCKPSNMYLNISSLNAHMNWHFVILALEDKVLRAQIVKACHYDAMSGCHM
jgi:siroheme synthase (precorrin-2 oxidase/ferrochelatase)